MYIICCGLFFALYFDLNLNIYYMYLESSVIEHIEFVRAWGQIVNMSEGRRRGRFLLNVGCCLTVVRSTLLKHIIHSSIYKYISATILVSFFHFDYVVFSSLFLFFFFGICGIGKFNIQDGDT